ncbi:hypothetical protein [Dysgonomonas sp. 511]|uniref:hypothetical protein n=1 Tax=Dysgonomonas sp. 511 TaxID=2302930 RepID=UPI0013D19730|nr:hypothetical protein [Dysgonomonas sp. 511]NDV78309.1 hypothetical protein [Dysgonomonas sp. 511]
MDIKKIILWIVVLVLVELVTIMVINKYYVGDVFIIIPNVLEFRPTFNTGVASTSVLNVFFLLRLVILSTLLALVFFFYRNKRKKKTNTKYLDIFFILIVSSAIISILSLIFKDINLSYILLNPFFTFGLIDIYTICGITAFLFHLIFPKKIE